MKDFSSRSIPSSQPLANAYSPSDKSELSRCILKNREGVETHLNISKHTSGVYLAHIDETEEEQQQYNYYDYCYHHH